MILWIWEMLDSPATSKSNILNMSGVGMGVVKLYTDNFRCILFCARDWPVWTTLKSSSPRRCPLADTTGLSLRNGSLVNSLQLHHKLLLLLYVSFQDFRWAIVPLYLVLIFVTVLAIVICTDSLVKWMVANIIFRLMGILTPFNTVNMWHCGLFHIFVKVIACCDSGFYCT